MFVCLLVKGELNLVEMLDDEREAVKELPFVVRALLHYLRAEEKERIHRINMCARPPRSMSAVSSPPRLLRSHCTSPEQEHVYTRNHPNWRTVCI